MASDCVFVPYIPMPAGEILQHPEILVETKVLSSSRSTNPKMLAPLANFFNDDIPLSGPQLESVHLAADCHNKFTGGARQGFIIGDGAGVGKGRQIAGIILNNYFCYRKKSLWISASKDLIVDGQRDMKEVSSKAFHEIEVFRPPKTFTKIPQVEGVLFVTYSFLSSKRTAKLDAEEIEKLEEFESRFDQVMDWLTNKFEGCIIFDEAHKAKGYSVFEKSTTIVGDTIHDLQIKLPNARVVYVSATLACHPEEMSYMERCGLWGGNSAFPTSSEFTATLYSRGIAALEHLPLEMKERKIFLSRHLSMEGVSFFTSKIPLPGGFEQLYEDSCTLWMLLHRLIIDSKERTLKGYFHAECQRFFRSLCVSAKVQGAVDITRQAVSEGKAVIIGLQSTGEASYNRYRCSKFHSTSEPFSNTVMILEEMLMKKLGFNSSEIGLSIPKKAGDVTFYHTSSPTTRKILKANRKLESRNLSENEEINEQSSSRTAMILHSYLETLQSLEDIDIRAEIIERFKNLVARLPNNPLDVLIKDLGGIEKVVELTGRVNYQQLQFDEKGAVIGHNVKRDAGSTGINVIEQMRFQSGKADIVIISEAASTGISLHSSRTFKNQKPRLHIMLEFPWSASVAIQQMGRSNRSNQANKPEYCLLISSISAEIRFANAVGQRMASMGALSKGDRRSSSDVWSQFDLNSIVAKESIQQLLKYFIGKNDRLNLFLGTEEDQKKKKNYIDMFCSLDILRRSLNSIKTNSRRTSFETFMNRILAVPVKFQSSVVNWFTICLENLKDDEDTKLSTGIRDIKELVKGEITISAKPKTDFILPDGFVSSLHYFEEMNGLSFQDLEDKLNKLTFYKQPPNKLIGEDSVVAVEKVPFNFEPNRFSLRVYSPLSKKAQIKPVTYIGNRSGLQEISRNDGKLIWMHQFSRLKRGICQNEYSSKTVCPQPCNHQKAVNFFGIVKGGCLNLWHCLEGIISNKTINLVKCDIGNNCIVGIHVDNFSIAKVENAIKGIVERGTF